MDTPKGPTTIPDGMVYTVSYSTQLNPEHTLRVGNTGFGWDVVVGGPEPLQVESSFHSERDAKDRGYQIARDHLSSKGVTGIADFDSLNWEEKRIGG